jgi:SAM-dependent methyltransferase
MTTHPQTAPTADDTALKAKHAAMWALGDYAAVARELIAELGGVLVEACEIGPGQRVLDVAAGTGNVAIPAARAGAEVVACDLSPELLHIGHRIAAEAGVSLEWRRADAEALPFDDASFDVVTSSVGVMFAPHHQVAADELVRVLRPGGRLGLVAWTPAGFIGQMFAVMKPYAAPPPPGAQPPPLWGDESHVLALLSDRVGGVEVGKRSARVHFDRPEDFRDFFKRAYGPTIVTYRGIADDPDRVAALDAALVQLARDHMDEHGWMSWEYLLLTAHRAR